MNTVAANSPYAQFKTNQQIEAEGIVLDYGTFYLRVGRAGGANKVFKRTMKRLFDPHRRAIQTETLSEKKITELMVQAYAEGNVYAWGYKKQVPDTDNPGKTKEVTVDGKMLDENGNEMDFTVDNIKKLFTDLPDLFADVQEQCGKVSLFRDVLDEEDGKNS